MVIDRLTLSVAGTSSLLQEQDGGVVVPMHLVSFHPLLLSDEDYRSLLGYIEQHELRVLLVKQ